MLQDPFTNVTAAQQALREHNLQLPGGEAVSAMYNGNVFVGFEGSAGAHHVTPRGLSAVLLGKLVVIEGIVSKSMCGWWWWCT